MNTEELMGLWKNYTPQAVSLVIDYMSRIVVMLGEEQSTCIDSESLEEWIVQLVPHSNDAIANDTFKSR